MIFSSPVFILLFLPLVLVVTLVSPRSWRNVELLAASLLFYAWGEGLFLVVMLASISANYGFGLWAERARARGAGRLSLVPAVSFNLGLLFVFKYANWIWRELSALVGFWSGEQPGLPELDPMHLPIGISFFTFQALSYVIDVQRGAVPAQRSWIRFGVYVSLFPQLVAGPIVRYRDVAAQIVSRTIRAPEFAEGVRRFVIGLAKKMLIANTLAYPVDEIFALPTEQIAPSVAWLAMVGYALQIYFDFSGYSDMAIGLGRMLGFRFLENFEYPYVARSITEFWRRWHISLSSWFRDYLYIPLGGNRGAPGRTYLNLLIVFVLCGLWHGASWSFLVWGLYHGCFLVIERAGLGRLLERLPNPLRLAYSLLVVLVGWVFFRSETLGQALDVLTCAFGAAGEQQHFTNVWVFATPVVWLALGVGIVASVPWLPAFGTWRVRHSTTFVRALAFEVIALGSIAVLFYLSMLELAAGSYNPFIYFRF
ncbi:MAG: alginate O-acetyltransferase complex protein AlgI [Chlamydiales bacterium]|jgi:alginate O-acetyltransferase complex protein AlgI